MDVLLYECLFCAMCCFGCFASLYIPKRYHSYCYTFSYLSFFETVIICYPCHGSNSDVRSKAFQAVDQFLQIAKQYYEKVYFGILFGFQSNAYYGS